MEFNHQFMYISHFIKQKSYEKIEFLLHRHPITFIPIAFIFLILMAVPFAIYFLISHLFPTLLTNTIYYTIAILSASIYYLSIYLFLYGYFVDFYLDIWIITNDRIVDIEQHGLFSRTIAELDLYRLQDVTVNVSGLFHTFFNFGDVVVKTASSNSHIVFYDIPNPNEVRRELIVLAEGDRRYHHNE